jgi:NADPH2:quinone reductase
MLALVADPASSSRIALREVPEPIPCRHELIVASRAFSLNRGEVRALRSAADGWRPGWDVAGDVVRAAADGSGPAVGSRVVGIVRGAAWAERVAVASSLCAVLPDAVDVAAAATLPVAGLTARRALAKAESLLGQRVLVTGAAGGVGRFAVQLAHLGGAHVTAVVGSAQRGQGLREIGADDVLTTWTKDGPPFDLILESVGGPSLAASLARVASGGTIVVYGTSSGEPTMCDAMPFYRAAGTTMYGLLVFDEVERRKCASADLTVLADLVAAGRLDTQIASVGSWRRPEAAIQALWERTVPGKAVLLVD